MKLSHPIIRFWQQRALKPFSKRISKNDIQYTTWLAYLKKSKPKSNCVFSISLVYVMGLFFNYHTKVSLISLETHFRICNLILQNQPASISATSHSSITSDRLFGFQLIAWKGSELKESGTQFNGQYLASLIVHHRSQLQLFRFFQRIALIVHGKIIFFDKKYLLFKFVQTNLSNNIDIVRMCYFNITCLALENFGRILDSELMSWLLIYLKVVNSLLSSLKWISLSFPVFSHGLVNCILWKFFLK